MSAVDNINDKLDKLNNHLERSEKIRDQVEKSAASIIAELTMQNQKILQILENIENHIVTCRCNLDLIEILKKEKMLLPTEVPTEVVQQTEEEEESKTNIIKYNMRRSGWYPENLDLGKDFVFTSQRYD